MANNTPFKPKQIYVNPDKLETIEPKLPPMPVIAKAQNVSSKQVTPQEAEIADIENQIAMAQTSQDNPQFKRSPEEEELKKKSIAYFLNQLDKPVATPRYMTIQDLFNKNADLSGVVPAFNPDFTRGLSSLFDTDVFNPRTGKVEDLAEDYARRKEAQMLAEQQKAMELQNQKDKLASNIYGIMNSIDTEAMREDRFNRQLAQQADQFAQTLDAKREDRNYERMREDKAIQRQIDQQNILNKMKEKEYELDKRRVEALEAQIENKTNKLTNAQKAALANINQMDTILKLIEKNPNSIGLWQGLNPAQNKYDSKTDNLANITTRTSIDKLRTEIRHTLTGAQFSPKEAKEYEKFLPTTRDNPEEVKAKIEGLKQMFYADTRLLGDVESADNVQNSTGFTQMKAPNGKIYNVPNDKVEEMKQKGGVVI